MTDPQCPCGTGLAYDECCGPFHRGEARAPTAERLMRSRYSAFALGSAVCADYLLSTWHSETRPRRLKLDANDRWLGLTVLATTRGGMLDAEGTVEFVARLEQDGQNGRSRASQREVSRFRREQSEWRYLDAI
jgi:SEC-C motif-containing protein